MSVVRKQQTGAAHGPGTGVSGGQFAAHAGGVGDVDTDLDGVPAAAPTPTFRDRQDVILQAIERVDQVYPPVFVRAGAMVDRHPVNDDTTLVRILVDHYQPLVDWYGDSDPESVTDGQVLSAIGDVGLPPARHVSVWPGDGVTDAGEVEVEVEVDAGAGGHHPSEPCTNPAGCVVCEWSGRVGSTPGLREVDFHDDTPDRMMLVFRNDATDALCRQQCAHDRFVEAGEVAEQHRAPWAFLETAPDRRGPQRASAARSRRILGEDRYRLVKSLSDEQARAGRLLQQQTVSSVERDRLERRFDELQPVTDEYALVSGRMAVGWPGTLGQLRDTIAVLGDGG